jgi:hypothetical protein
MGQLGIGAMIHYLGGGSDNDPQKYIGRKIGAVAIEDNKCRITFANGDKIALWDNGQSCCEHRYMNCDDDLSYYIGATWIGVECRSAEDSQGEYDVHECAFVEVKTDKGSFTLANHNEHNGYYGGFGLTITEE